MLLCSGSVAMRCRSGWELMIMGSTLLLLLVTIFRLQEKMQ